jgi:hypothetical protein
MMARAALLALIAALECRRLSGNRNDRARSGTSARSDDEF